MCVCVCICRYVETEDFRWLVIEPSAISSKIIVARSGVRVRVGNTDAEGRSVRFIIVLL